MTYTPIELLLLDSAQSQSTKHHQCSDIPTLNELLRNENASSHSHFTLTSAAKEKLIELRRLSKDTADFRQLSTQTLIYLEHRKKMRHPNKLLSPKEIEKLQISNPRVRILLLAQWKYWNRTETQEIKLLTVKSRIAIICLFPLDWVKTRRLSWTPFTT